MVVVQELALLVGHCTDYQMPQLLKVSTRAEFVTFSHFVKFKKLRTFVCAKKRETTKRKSRACGDQTQMPAGGVQGCESR